MSEFIQHFRQEEEKRIDTDFLLSADLHVGSTTAIFPCMIMVDGKYVPIDETGGYYLKNNARFYPNGEQKRIFNHYDHSLDLFNEFRTSERVVYLIDGDSIDGSHHGTHQLVTHIQTEQVNACTELVRYTKARIAFQEGIDKLLITEGTESHTRDDEVDLAQKVNAEYFSFNEQLSPFIELHVNGLLIWIYHHGAGIGTSPNKGNALRNKLRNIYYQCLEDGKQVPDVVITAHTHTPDHQIYMYDFKEMHGIILPSQQSKTRWAYGKVPTSLTRVGLQFMNISKDGGIKIPKPKLLELPLGHTVRI